STEPIDDAAIQGLDGVGPSGGHLEVGAIGLEPVIEREVQIACEALATEARRGTVALVVRVLLYQVVDPTQRGVVVADRQCDITVALPVIRQRDTHVWRRHASGSLYERSSQTNTGGRVCCLY